MGLAIPVLLGLTALGVDSATITRQKDWMQNTADSVSLAVAKELTSPMSRWLRLPRQGSCRAERTKTAPMAGILFYSTTSGEKFKISNDSARKLLGTICLPNASLEISGEGKLARESVYTVILADTFKVDGSNLVINADYAPPTCRCRKVLVRTRQGLGWSLRLQMIPERLRDGVDRLGFLAADAEKAINQGV